VRRQARGDGYLPGSAPQKALARGCVAVALRRRVGETLPKPTGREAVLNVFCSLPRYFDERRNDDPLPTEPDVEWKVNRNKVVTRTKTSARESATSTSDACARQEKDGRALQAIAAA
jgi:hypothetical protein